MYAKRELMWYEVGMEMERSNNLLWFYHLRDEYLASLIDSTKHFHYILRIFNLIST